MVYRNHTTDKSVEVANQNDPSTLHIHQMSWEYYITLKGVMVLQIEDELVAINAGEVLEVPPRARHMLHTVDTPFEGFVFRVPLVDDKVEF
jgi:mannose-6-phosphate isomerase-like protein (cupin superfamily)